MTGILVFAAPNSSFDPARNRAVVSVLLPMLHVREVFRVRQNVIKSAILRIFDFSFLGDQRVDAVEQALGADPQAMRGPGDHERRVERREGPTGEPRSELVLVDAVRKRPIAVLALLSFQPFGELR